MIACVWLRPALGLRLVGSMARPPRRVRSDACVRACGCGPRCCRAQGLDPAQEALCAFARVASARALVCFNADARRFGVWMRAFADVAAAHALMIHSATRCVALRCAGVVLRVLALRCVASRFVAYWCGVVLCCVVVAWRGVAWRGVAWRVAWRGVARGMAWRAAWRGKWRGARKCFCCGAGAAR